LPDRESMAELLRIALPMVISQGAFAVMVFCDRLFMSFIDPLHMASALGGGVASFFTLSLFIGVLSYGNALVAQYYGAGDHHKCPRVVTQGLLMAALSTPLVLFIAAQVAELFSTMGHAPEQVSLERAYYRVLMLGCFFNLSKTCIACYFAGIGRTRVVMVADVLGMLLNVPLSWALIFGKFGLPEAGITGAAWGTVIANLFSLCVFAAIYLQRDHRLQFAVRDSFRLDTGILRRYLRLGLPSGIELFMNVATFNLFLLMYQAYGIAHGAAAAIVFNWDMVSFVPMIGIHIGVISLIGRYVGSGDMSRVDAVLRAGFVMSLTYSAILGLIFLIFRTELVLVFASSGADFEEILAISSFMMVGLSCYVMADATIQVAGGALRGAGDTRWLMTVSISLHCIMLAAQYLIIMVFEVGYRASWIVFVVMIIAIAVTYVVRLRGNVWRQPDRLARVLRD
jgi:MATE family multidrug resistance protein